MPRAACGRRRIWPITRSSSGRPCDLQLPRRDGLIAALPSVGRRDARPDAQYPRRLQDRRCARPRRRAYRDRSAAPRFPGPLRYLGDTDFVQVPVAKLIDKAYAHSRAASINPNIATPLDALTITPLAAVTESYNTTHYSVIDVDGNRVGATLSINSWFGAGVDRGRYRRAAEQRNRRLLAGPRPA